jgi:hypothetical protein
MYWGAEADFKESLRPEVASGDDDDDPGML